MGRLIWILGEIVVGVLVGGLVGALVVPVMQQTGWGNGPWVAWLSVAVGMLASILAGEGLWKRRRKTRAA